MAIGGWRAVCERCSLGALRTRLSAGVPLSRAPVERAILPNVVLRLEAAWGAAMWTVDSSGECRRQSRRCVRRIVVVANRSVSAGDGAWGWRREL